jgi:hypothetical protein
MGKIRHANINAHLNTSDSFETMMTQLVELYATCPDASKIRFIQAIEDRFKASAPARGRSANGSSSGGATWRAEQKALYAGRGAKWKSIPTESSAFEALRAKLNEFASDGIDIDSYQNHISNAGFAWVRYSGPRGSEAEPMHAFEVRTQDSRVDHPKQLLLLTDTQVQDLTTLSATPFALGLENAQRRAPSPQSESQPEVTEEAINEPASDVPAFDPHDMLTDDEDELLDI